MNHQTLPMARKSLPSKTSDEGDVVDGDLTVAEEMEDVAEEMGDVAEEMGDVVMSELKRLRAKEAKKRAQGVKYSAK